MFGVSSSQNDSTFSNRWFLVRYKRDSKDIFQAGNEQWYRFQQWALFRWRPSPSELCWNSAYLRRAFTPMVNNVRSSKNFISLTLTSSNFFFFFAEKICASFVRNYRWVNNTIKDYVWNLFQEIFWNIDLLSKRNKI